MADDAETKPEAEETPAPAEQAAPASEEAAPAAKAEEAPAAEAEVAPAAKAEEDAPKNEEDAPASESKEGEEPAEEEKPERPRTAEDVFLALEGEEEQAKQKVFKAKGSKNVQIGIVHIQATYNNTVVSVSDANGNVIGWSSAGKMGFRGSRKSTAYAAQLVSQDACRQAMAHGFKTAEVRVKGPGSGRESAVRAVQALGIDVTGIRDVTPIPHNGCRPKKPRRV